MTHKPFHPDDYKLKSIERVTGVGNKTNRAIRLKRKLNLAQKPLSDMTTEILTKDYENNFTFVRGRPKVSPITGSHIVTIDQPSKPKRGRPRKTKP